MKKMLTLRPMNLFSISTLVLTLLLALSGNEAKAQVSFTGGSRVVMPSICEDASATLINSQLTASDPTAGLTLTWSVVTGPTNGSLSGFSTSITSTGSAVTPSGLNYTPAGAFVGNDSFTVQVTDGGTTATTRIVVTVNPLPVVAPITGITHQCIGGTTTLSDATSGGSWLSTFGAASIDASSGIVTTVGTSPGSGLIFYSVTNSFSCTTIISTNDTVLAVPTVPAPSGPTSVCGSATIALTDALTGGTWSSRDNTIATVDGTGHVTGVATGSVEIIYGVTNSCGTGSDSVLITVSSSSLAALAGPDTVCTSSSITLTESVTGGAWSSSSSANATVDASGHVFGVASGSTHIFYTITDGCGTRSVNKLITVVSVPSVPSISGATSVCVNSTTTLTDGLSGGSWSSSNAGVATITTPGGVVGGGGTAGAVTITYSVTNLCGTAFVTAPMTVTGAPATPAAITGTTTVCTGSSTPLADGTSGGAWSSVNTAKATVDAGGRVFVVTSTADTVTIVYTVSNACGSSSTSTLVTILTSPITPSPIVGPTSVCTGATIGLTDASPGGTWSTSNGTVATVAGGTVGGASNGTAYISYTVSNSCGTASVESLITVSSPPATPASIGGVPTVCAGSSVTLTETSTGGTWSTSSGLATVSGGIVTGISAGSLFISYTVSNTCGSASAVIGFTVTDVPVVAAISGVASMCSGGTTTFTDATSGGTWGTTNPAVATVAGGVVFAVAGGTTNITYSVSNSCGTTTKTFAVTVVDVPTTPAGITGPGTVCVGSNITLSETTGGGTWSSSVMADATVSVTGTVHGIAVGGTSIIYTVSNACGSASTSYGVSVDDVPSAPAIITGAGNVCIGSFITLSDATSGGVWSSLSPGVATVDVGGDVYGVTTGTAVIKYTVSNTCGSAFKTASVTVITVPAVPAAIGGPATVCAGAAVTETDGTAGGSWSVYDASIATITAGGSLTGLSVGSDSVYYTSTNTCGSSYIAKAITVTGAPTVLPITGATTVCLGGSTNLSDGTSGGTWHSSNTAVATVIAATGQVFGAGAGSVTISYTVTNGCGSTIVTYAMTVITAPSVPASIAGPVTVCQGAAITLTDATSGGTWSSVSTGVATVDVSGNVYGVSGPGASTISYTVSNACGLAAATQVVAVTTAPSVAAITGTSTMCVSSNITLSCATGGGTWVSSNTGVATITGGGVVFSGASAGSTTISYTVTNSCGSTTSTRVVTVGTGPVTPPAITGTNTVCVGGTTALADATGGGVWSSVFPARATVSSGGVVYGVSAGQAIISYTVTNSCGTAVVTDTLTVTTVPTVPPTVTGFDTACLGSFTTFADDSSGGTWISGSTSIATVDAAGRVYGAAIGTATISYVLNNACGSSSPATRLVKVTTVPTVPAIFGSTVVCVGGTTVLTDGTSGGAWSSGSPLVATVSSGGMVTGVNTGVASISYTLTNICGSNSFVRSMTVNTVPAAPAPISGTTTLCLGGSTTTLSDDSTGGIWSSVTTTVANISSSGVVSSAGLGTSIISYTVTNACGPTAVTTTVNVITLPTVPAITGTARECIGSVSTLSDAAGGGTWLTGGASIATVSTTGDVTGVSAGIIPIIYEVTNMCGTTAKFINDTVDNSVVASIAGPHDICVGATGTLTCATTGGTWTCADFTIATVNASTGVVTGVSVGSTTVTYTVVNSCGTNTVTYAVHISSSYVASISGSSTICVGANSTLTDSVTGGTWVSTDGSIATIDATTGVMGGVSSGSVVIQYSVTNGCGGPFSQFLTVNVNPLAVPGTITGSSSVVCMGSILNLSDATTGGTWSSSNNSLATVNSSGAVTGVSNGSVVISYTVTNSCGPISATYAVTVNPLPIAGTISGSTTVCATFTSALTNTGANGPGSWVTSNPSVSTVDASGTLGGVAAGTDTVYYIVTNSCGTDSTMAMVTVNPLPNAGSISGLSTICQLTTTTLTDTASASTGVWSSSNSSVASVDPATGVVTGVSGGTCTITYTTTSGLGCTAFTTYAFTVTPIPAATSIGGTPSVCMGSTTTLTDGVSGGTWISDNAIIATVDASGTVYGVNYGTVIITYEYTNACGTADSITTVTVNPAPDAGFITGLTSVCLNSATALSTTATGGTWSSSNMAVATVDGSGDVFGVTVGIALITYEVVNGCGVSDSVVTMTVLPLADSGVISGTTEICQGSATTLAETVPGGFWFSTDPTVATVDITGGTVYGVGGGVCLIIYSVTNSCNTASTYTFFTVDPTPFVIGIVATADTICEGGGMSYLSDSVTGGTWTSSNTSIATVDPTSGIVYGVSTGSVDITYTVSLPPCGTADTFIHMFVAPLPHAGTISGTTPLCATITETMTTTATGGRWTSSDNTIATVDTASGLVTGVSAGFIDISYTVVNSCGTDFSTFTLEVDPQPFAGTVVSTSGIDSVCVNSTLTLSNSVAGGTWTSGTPLIATVDASGVVYGVLAGTAVISYTITNSCGHADSTITIQVLPLPTAGTITGSPTVCQYSTTAFSDAATGGLWSSSNTAVATVDVAGVVHGVTAGNAIISYSVSTFHCGTAVDTQYIVVLPAPDSGAITGSNHVCLGATTTLADASAVGTGRWSSSSTAVATVDATTGVVGGVAAGTSFISYIATTVCGSDSVGFTMTVEGLPNSGTIFGRNYDCIGASTRLSDTSGSDRFGKWYSVNGKTTVDLDSGTVTGVTGGLDTILYVVTTAHCGTDTARYVFHIYTIPDPGVITGSSPICVGTTHYFTESVSTGTWSSLYGYANVSSTGFVTGMAAGIDTIFYTTTNSCGTVRAAFPVVVNALPVAGTIVGTTTLCSGTSSRLSDTASGGTGTWSSSSGLVTITGAGDTVTITAAGTSGTDTVSYSVTSSVGCASTVATAVVTINPLPHAGTIYGPTQVCSTRTITLSDTTGTPGGAWHTSDAARATVTSGGVVTGVAAGTVTISYVVYTASCGADSTGYTITVNPLPVAGTVSGTSPICSGTTTPYSATGSAGGRWTSVPTTVATVDPTTGVVTGVGAGTAVISYAVTNVCGSDTAHATIVINAAPDAGTITGTDSVCDLTTVTLSDATGTSGGFWGSEATTIATVGAASGIVGGAAPGTVTIFYAVSTASCGSDTAYYSVRVLPLADTGIGGITGVHTVCAGSYDTLHETATGGAWSTTSGAIATVSSTGVVGGHAAGTTTISYTATNGCGTLSATFSILVNPLPDAGTLSGPHSVCAGDSITIAETGGTGSAVWSNGGFGVDIFGDTTGTTAHVIGVAAGSDIVTYTATTACGSDSRTYAITVNPLPDPGVISGPTAVCQGSTIDLTESVSGGTWFTRGSTIATVSSTGTVTGVAAGTIYVSYLVPSSFGCHNDTTWYEVTVNPLPVAGTISGPSYVCVAGSITLTDVGGTTGGSWSTAGASIATITSGGVLYGVSAGSVVVTYTAITATCGDTSTTTTITVHPLPDAGAIISSTSEFCSGTTVTMTETVSGGTWSGSSGVTVVGTGTSATVTAGSTGGPAYVFYSVTSAFSCGTAVDTFIVTVDPYPTVAPISGVVSVCSGSAAASLTDATGGGTWSSRDPGIASVDPSTGSVTPVSVGVDSIYYSVSNSCGTTRVAVAYTVNVTPVAGTITGASFMCPGTTATLTAVGTTGGGSWYSTNTGLALVSPTTGVVTALAAGVDSIVYVIRTATCGSDSATFVLTVNPLPSPGTISPAMDTVCVGSSVILADAAPGGVWTSNNITIGSVNTVGQVFGLNPGWDTVTYAVTNGCGTNYAFAYVLVNPLPNAGSITGGSGSLCVGTPVSFSATVAGGAWSLTNTLATISGGGTVIGLSGIITSLNDTIRYSVSNSCGTAIATRVVTINPLPFAGTIVGIDHICQNDSVLYTNPTGLQPGYWTSSNPTYGPITTSSGDSATIYGLYPGTTVLTYHFTNYCGSATDTLLVTVRAAGHCEDGVAIQTAANGEIGIYPNPAVNTLHIDAPVTVNVAVMSTDGKVIFRKDQVKDIDVSSLANGLYMIMVYDEHNELLKVAKFIKAD